MVGKQVKHKFKDEDACEEQWYNGTIINYNPYTKLHEVSYHGEEEHCFFNSIQNLITGDLIINNN